MNLQDMTITGKTESSNPFHAQETAICYPVEGGYPGSGGWGSEDDIRLMFHASAEAFWQMDKSFRFTFTNAACEKVSGGFTGGEFIGTSILEYLTQEGIEHLARVNGSRRKREARGVGTELMFYELQMRRKNGTCFWAGISSCPMRDGNGKVIGYQGIMRDISAYKQYEIERRKLENLLKREERQAAGEKRNDGVARRMNRIMDGIIGYSERIIAQEEPEKHAGYVMDPEEKAAAMMQDLLTISGKDPANRKPVNLNELVPACLKKNRFQKLSENFPGIVIDLDLEPALRPVSGSAPQLDKAFTNLICMSCEKAGPGGAVSIATRTVYLGSTGNRSDDLNEGEFVVLSVSDNGAGMADENLHHVFEPFYMRKVMKKGATGLELSVLREVVKDHGGYVNVVSGIGSGATFIVYLPVARGEKQWSYMMQSDVRCPGGRSSMN